MLKKWMNGSKKKGMGLVLVGMLAVVGFGGTAYAAYGESWDGYIKSGIEKVYSVFFPEIGTETKKKENEISSNIVSDVKRNVTEATSSLTNYKDELIKRNKNELDHYYQSVKQKAEKTKNTAVNEKKKALKAEADKKLKASKDEIDRQIEEQLKKVK